MTEEGGLDDSFVLVQEYVAGQNLAELIGDGLRMNDVEIRDFLREMLEILRYLHALERPVIHRDIKPSNIIRRLDGRWTLIDFGAVQSNVSVDGSTQELITVGTTGYMPFEQIMGRAVPASDLYALGATAVHVLSHQHPNDLPVDDAAFMKLLFQPHITASPQISDLLEGLLEPLVENRVQSAREALLWLDEPGFRKRDASVAKSAVLSRDPIPGAMRVRDHKVSFRLKKRGTGFGKRGGLVRTFRLLVGSVFVLHALFRVLAENALFDWFLWGQLVVMLVYLIHQRATHLVVTREAVRISSPWFWLWKRRVALGEVSDVRVVPYRTLFGRTRGFMVEVLTTGGDVIGYGTGQSREESEWLALEIRRAIEKFSDSRLMLRALV